MSATAYDKRRVDDRRPAPEPEPESPAVLQLKRELAGMPYQAQAEAIKPPMPVQLTGASPDAHKQDVHSLARAGVSGSGGRLPYLDKIQHAFGKHDVSSVSAHVGGRAAQASAAMGAEAYATGDQVAFKGAPSLKTVAHEAAHVIQQRQGVSLPGGVSQVGDTYEQHADRVADAVSKGQSAEALLDAHTGSGDHAVQRAPTLDPNHQKWIDDPTQHPFYAGFMAKVDGSAIPNNIGGRIFADAVRGIYKQDPAERQGHLTRMASFLRQHLAPPATGKVSFYSGRGARDEAVRSGYNILEQQAGAAIFDKLDFVSTGAQWVGTTPDQGSVRALWATISTTFAEQVRGEVHTMLAFWSGSSVYVADELKVLTDNGITPIYHAVAGFPHDRSTGDPTGTAQIDASGNITKADTPLATDAAARAAIDAWNARTDADRNAQWLRLGHR